MQYPDKEAENAETFIYFLQKGYEIGVGLPQTQRRETSDLAPPKEARLKFDELVVSYVQSLGYSTATNQNWQKKKEYK